MTGAGRGKSWTRLPVEAPGYRRRREAHIDVIIPAARLSGFDPSSAHQGAINHVSTKRPISVLVVLVGTMESGSGHNRFHINGLGSSGQSRAPLRSKQLGLCGRSSCVQS